MNENLLFELEDYIRTMWNFLPTPIAFINPKGVIIESNDLFGDIFGLQKTEIIGLLISELSEKFEEIHKNTITHDFVSDKEIHILKEDKELIFIVSTKTYSDKKRKIGYFISLLNITEKKSIEKLEIQRDKQNEINNMRNKFFMRFSHELRHPLVPILGYTNLMLEDEVSKSHKNYLKKIRNNANQLKSLINKVIEVTSLETGEIKIKKKKTRIKPFIKKIAETYSKKAKEKKLKFSLNAKDCMVNFDSEKIEIAISNLLDNAIKFTKKGSILLSVNCNNKNVTIIVKDTGKGMNDKELSKIKKEFYVLDQDVKSMYTGFHLGIFLVKLIINAHNGSFEITSKKNKGTIVKIEIPIK